MPLVVLLRGVNVGGHRSFRPTVLARQLKHLHAVNIGAAGTFIVWRPVTRSQLRAEISRLLPFETEIIICRGSEITSALSREYFTDPALPPDVVRFVSVLSRRPSSAPLTPIRIPSTGEWMLRILAREGRFVFGVYRRHMKVIGYLGMLDRLFGVPATTRGWTTLVAIGRLLARGEAEMDGVASS